MTNEILKGIVEIALELEDTKTKIKVLVGKLELNEQPEFKEVEKGDCDYYGNINYYLNELQGGIDSIIGRAKRLIKGDSND
jgi:hypothetical protein